MLSVKTPAKVNLFLDVVGKRKDGYHTIRTLFLKVGLFDTLYFQKQENGIKISCSGRPVPVDKSNLAYRAAELLQDACGTKQGVHIKIKKNIPISAGMGGGSSDAAAALRGLNRLWKLNLSDKVLMRLGARLGADVPFFLFPESAAWGTGRGDRLKPVEIKKKFWLVVVKPPIAVSTREAYQALPGSLTKRKNDVKLLIYALNNFTLEKIGEKLFNRLESVVFERYNSLARLKKRLSALGVKAVLMSGSGSVIFGLTANREEAKIIKRNLHNRHEVMIVRSL